MGTNTAAARMALIASYGFAVAHDTAWARIRQLPIQDTPAYNALIRNVEAMGSLITRLRDGAYTAIMAAQSGPVGGAWWKITGRLPLLQYHEDRLSDVGPWPSTIRLPDGLVAPAPFAMARTFPQWSPEEADTIAPHLPAGYVSVAAQVADGIVEIDAGIRALGGHAIVSGFTIVNADTVASNRSAGGGAGGGGGALLVLVAVAALLLLR